MWQRWNATTKIFEVSTDNGGSWNPLALDAAILTQGLISDPRLDLGAFASYTPTVTAIAPTTITIVGSSSAYYRIFKKILFLWYAISNFDVGVAATTEIYITLPVGVTGGLGAFNAVHPAFYWVVGADWLPIMGYSVTGENRVRAIRSLTTFPVGAGRYLWGQAQIPIT